ncbi:MAG TPA: alpha/beta fold hydrolase [Bryobacteraceae bacterium]|nr:alpha/beta fold hydrolase [Bryobacteraceae bacterium]
MRILLAANASYVPPRGGATRSNLVWLEALAAHGHECRVVSALLGRNPAERKRQLDKEELHVEVLHAEDGYEVMRHGKLEVHAASEPARRNEILREQIRTFQPDWVLVSSEDVGQVLLAEASRFAPGRVVYLAHTPQFLPFGPESWSPNPQGAALAREAARVIVIGKHMAGYVERHLGRKAEIVHPPIYGSGPWPNLARFGQGLVTMINPSAIKGLPIFLEVARRMPHVRFGALPGWGTTAADRRALEALPNITLLANRRDISDILRETQILLMPSLWYEGFGLIVMEAMLRGIPVVASDSGGLLEAKAGTGYVIPVRPIESYEPVYDERAMPRAVTPPQDVEPWVAALAALTGNRALYDEESKRSREAAAAFVAALDPRALERSLERAAQPMRILLAHNSLYYPAHGGGDRSNRLLVEALAAGGHTCRVVARLGNFGEEEHAQYVKDLSARGVTIVSADDGIVALRLNGVEAHVLTNHPRLRAYFAKQIQEFAPDVIISSTDDPAQLMLEAALESPARVVYLARATLALPFGPDCAFPSASKTATLQLVDGAVGVSQYVADYMRKYGGMDAVHVPISLMEPGPEPAALGRIENEFVTLVNPCAVKGITILLALADRMPDVTFAAVPTWGTNATDFAALSARPNIRVLPPVDDIDDLLSRTRVLLVPSLWAEARSRIIVEAMLRGVPVLASDAGGIPEAKMGVPYLLPVRQIEHYRGDVDEHMVPVADVPEQDLGPWEAALRRVLTDAAHYEDVSRASRAAALDYVRNVLSIRPFESYLRDALARPRRRDREAMKAAPAQEPPRSALEKLSPEKRRLLALRLKKAPASQAGMNAWFPALELRPGASIRLFAFPHAGAGAAAFHGWNEKLPGAFSVCPVRLPGRESRSSEAPHREMCALVEAIGSAIEQHTGTPFAFFGHSMGAGVAFGVARWLRRKSLPIPVALCVSGARAPQYRRNWTPPQEPSDEEIVSELRKRDGMPSEVLDDPELMRLLLPPLKADTFLYRNWSYTEEPPLPCPIRAYGGAEDENVAREHLEAWREQTCGSFAMRIFPGGHFYLRTHQSEFLDALGRDLDELRA